MVRAGVAGLVLAIACSPRNAVHPSSPADAPTEPVATPRRDAVGISGQVLAHDGAPLLAGDVKVMRQGFVAPAATATLDEHGGFAVELTPGVYHVTISAVNHAQTWRTLVVRDAVRVQGRLGTYARSEPGQTIRLQSAWMDADGRVLRPGPSAATRTAAGVYRIVEGERPAGAAKLRYQLVTASGGRTFNGPLADAFVADGGGDYWSVVDLAAHPELELDLGAMPPAGVAPALQWQGEPQQTAALQDFIARWRERVDAVRRQIPLRDGKLLELTDANREALERLADEAQQEVDREPDAALRVKLAAARASLFWTLLPRFQEPSWQRETLEWMIATLLPDDIHFVFFPNLDHLLFAALREADADLTSRTEAWLARRAAENPEPASALEALVVLIDQADRRKDTARVRELYAQAQAERFRGAQLLEMMRTQYDPDRPLQVGRMLPSLDVPSLDGKGRVTSAALQGRVFLLEFWATWCGPCVLEQPKLHAAYARVNGARPPRRAKAGDLRRLGSVASPQVEFVFVSLDGAPADVDAFRSRFWSMPWIHAFVGNEREHEVQQRFGFLGVPTAVLVDERGVILEVGEALRGDALEATLTRVLASRVATSR